MRGRSLTTFALAIALIGLAGCSRTVEDVSKWEEAGNTEKLKEALADPKVEVRKAAAESLGTLKAEDAVGVLAACLNDAEESVQVAAVASLAAIGNNTSITPLIAALKLNHTDSRILAANTLGEMKAKAAVEGLSELLDDPDESIQLAACKAIGQIRSEVGSQPLANKLANTATSSRVRMACIDALANTGGTTALEALVGILADNDDRIRDATTAALIKIGDPAVPSIMEGLRSGDSVVRGASITLLRGLDAIPTRDSGLVWFQLARASLAENEKIRSESIATLASEGAKAVPTLLTAAALNSAEIREPAALALEWIGDASVEPAVTRATRTATPKAKNWFEGRTTWAGAPSQFLDLWGATSSLNPDLAVDENTLKALQAGGSAATRVLALPDFEPTRVYIPYLINLFDDDTCASIAKKKVEEAGNKASLPLIAAMTSDKTAVAETAAGIMAGRADARAYPILTQTIQARLDAGEALSKSSLYTALLKLDMLDAEPLILKIRPNAERAIMVFSKQFRDAKTIGAETSDPYTDNEAPVVFRVAYIQEGKPGTLEVSFKKDTKGNWRPSPALPYKLPDPK